MFYNENYPEASKDPMWVSKEVPVNLEYVTKEELNAQIRCLKSEIDYLKGQINGICEGMKLAYVTKSEFTELSNKTNLLNGKISGALECIREGDK